MRLSSRYAMIAALALALVVPVGAAAVDPAARQKLDGFDAWMEKLLADWNTAGAAVGVVVGHEVVLAKGYGYRDYGKKQPVTPNTLFQIASNTKLFTTVAVGMLVQEGKLDWDKPVRDYVPSIQFYNDELNRTVTIRDMLAHRTGVSRHDLIWYKSDFTRQELYDRLRYLEPSQPLRQGFLYNNMMYAAAGQIVQELSGKAWEDFVRERIFQPLQMRQSMFSVEEMQKRPDYGIPYTEQRDSTLLYRIPFYEEARGIGPAGSIISNIDDMTHWLSALMNGGMYAGRQVLPAAALRASLEPSIAVPNAGLENRGWKELLNAVYGMGRFSAAYRGHYVTYHGGDLPGFHSQVSCMPYDSVGVVTFLIGDHAAPLYNIITWNVYERLLGLDQTPWSERRLKDRLDAKAAGKAGRKQAGSGRVAGTRPSHALADYAGDYENPAYGILRVALAGDSLRLHFHRITLPLHHYHYDRFDSPDDEQDGLWSLSFGMNPQGDIDRITTSLDEAEATFTRKVDATLSDPKVLARYLGRYKMAGAVVEAILVDGNLVLNVPGAPRLQLLPLKPATFRAKDFADLQFAFTIENDQVTAMKQIDPSGEYKFERMK